MIERLRTAAFAVLGAILPIRYTSRIYLLQQLARFGIEGLPRGAVQELADDAVHLAKTFATLHGTPWRVGITDWLDGQAASVASLLQDDRNNAGRQEIEGDQRERLVAILEVHGVNVPPVDALGGD